MENNLNIASKLLFAILLGVLILGPTVTLAARFNSKLVIISKGCPIFRTALPYTNRFIK